MYSEESNKKKGKLVISSANQKKTTPAKPKKQINQAKQAKPEKTIKQAKPEKTIKQAGPEKPIKQAGPVKKKKPTKQTNKRRVAFSPLAIVIAIVAILAMGTGGGYALWYYSYTDVALADYTNITYEGYDHRATASIEIAGDSEYSDFFQTVTGSMNIDNNLSNGQEITVTYAYDEATAKENKLRIDSSDLSEVVEGLPSATVVDQDFLFSGAEVQYDGISPCIVADVVNVSDDTFVSKVVYSIVSDGKVFYENGENVIVKAEIPEELYSDPAYDIQVSGELLEKGFATPIGDSYITDASLITDDMISQLEKAGLELISKADAKEYGLRIFQHEAHLKPVFVGNTTTFKWVNPYAISAYFHTITEFGKKSVDNHANDVQIVYGVTLTQQDGTSCLTEMVIQFANILQHTDGTFDLNLDSGRIVSATYRDSNIKKLVSDSSGVYDTVKLTE